MESLWNELKRRNVVRVGIAYAVAAWVSLEVINFAIDVIGAPHWILQLFSLLAVLGFPAALVFAWVYEMTPEGIKKEKEVDRDQSISPQTGRKLDRVIIGILALLVVVLGTQQFLMPGSQSTSSKTKEGGPASIAVLPFEDYSEANDQEYFSRGIAEEILNLLAKTNALRVAARTSSFAFADSDTDIRDIGKKLDVSTVLEGSIRKAGPKIRITAQLINVEDGYHLWSETYDRDFTDIFKIQDEIAASIIDSLRVHLLGEEQELMVSERAASVDAYSAYLIGKERLALLTKEDIEAARGQFEEAIRIDPDFAPAHVQLAYAALLLGESRFGGKDITSEQVDSIAIPHLEKALILTPNSADAIAVQGLQRLNRYRFAEAEKAFNRAIQLSPNYALAYNWRAASAYNQGRYLDMLADREKAYALDPMSLEISAALAFDYRSFGRPQDAERVINRMFYLHPDHPLAYEAALENLDAHGHEAEAVLMAEKALADHPGDENFLEWKAWMLLEMGAFEEAEAVGVESITGTAYSLQGRTKEAQEILEKKIAEDDTNINALRDGIFFYGGRDDSESLLRLKTLVDRTMAIGDENSVPWREKCDVNFVPPLQKLGYDKEVSGIMSACRKDIEQRLQAGYLCPCTWYSVVAYTILEDDLDLAVKRAQKWFDDGDSMSFIENDPTFKRLKNRPEYPELLRRNQEEMARERAIYEAAKAKQSS